MESDPSFLSRLLFRDTREEIRAGLATRIEMENLGKREGKFRRRKFEEISQSLDPIYKMIHRIASSRKVSTPKDLISDGRLIFCHGYVHEKAINRRAIDNSRDKNVSFDPC